MNDIEHNEATVKLLGMLVYNKMLSVERTNSAIDTIVIHLKNDQALDMYTLREFVKLGFELRSISVAFEPRTLYDDAGSIVGNADITFVRSSDNQTQC